tara:strand:+ start:1573 stop:2460 length:888 start_codon:yes stop_codon:yes gene_type:complete
MEIRRKAPNPKIRVENLEYGIPHKDSKPKNILEEIVWYKDIEVTNFKKSVPLEELIKNIENLPPTKQFINEIVDSDNKPAIIAEIKKASPSKGVIRNDFNPTKIASIYEQSGATCISVLTDKKFFQGGFEILSNIRKTTQLPLLCKDFIISAYQIYKARCSGADAILLIAAILTNSDLIYLKKIADKLNLDVLVEVHDKSELKRILKLNCFNLIGINNRDLKTFKTDLNVTFNLMDNLSNDLIKKKIVFISESGINNNLDLIKLRNHGIKGVLIGERLMKDKNIENSFKTLLKPV